MSELLKVKLVSGDRKKSQIGNRSLAKKIFRKVAEQQTDDVGKLSVNVENTHEANAVTEAKPKIQQRTLTATKEAVKNMITQSVVKSSAPKPYTKKYQATKLPLNKIKILQSNKKSPMVRNPNSMTVNTIEKKRMKPTKRVLKAIPMTVTLPRNTEFQQVDETKLTFPSEKLPVKVKQVFRKKLVSALNGKTTKPKTIGSMALENVLPIINTTKPLLVMTTQTQHIKKINK